MTSSNPFCLDVGLRNWSHKRIAMHQADAFVVSVPKSGRTWLRVCLQHYFCSKADMPLTLSTPVLGPRKIPSLHFSHDLWHHLTTPRWYERMLGAHLIPPGLRDERKVVLLLRDPRDVLVSLYLHLQKRGFKTGASFQGTLSELIRDRRFGIHVLVAIQNYWLNEWGGSDRCLIWRYEDCFRNPEAEFAKVIRFIDDRPVDGRRLRESISFSGFDNMQRMERENAFDRAMLRPGDRSDPESFKVRRGVVGGYQDYLNDEDVRYIERAMKKLFQLPTDFAQAG